MLLILIVLQNKNAFLIVKVVFVNRKVLQRSVEKASTFNTQYACSDCVDRAPTLTFWCANRSSPFARVLELFCEGRVRETLAPLCSPFGADRVK